MISVFHLILQVRNAVVDRASLNSLKLTKTLIARVGESGICHEQAREMNLDCLALRISVMMWLRCSC